MAIFPALQKLTHMLIAELVCKVGARIGMNQPFSGMETCDSCSRNLVKNHVPQYPKQR